MKINHKEHKLYKEFLFPPQSQVTEKKCIAKRMCKDRQALLLPSMWRWKTHKVHIKPEWNARGRVIVQNISCVEGRKNGFLKGVFVFNDEMLKQAAEKNMSNRKYVLLGCANVVFCRLISNGILKLWLEAP